MKTPLQMYKSVRGHNTNNSEALLLTGVILGFNKALPSMERKQNLSLRRSNDLRTLA